MMKKLLVVGMVALCLIATLSFSACSQPAKAQNAGSSSAASAGLSAQSTGSSSAASASSSAKSSGSSAQSGSATLSLVAYHSSLGQDISDITEVSAEACGKCHGEWTEIQSKTADILTYPGSVLDESANPHANHFTKDIACSDCHNLTGASVLMCDKACHHWYLDTGNGLWEEN